VRGLSGNSQLKYPVWAGIAVLMRITEKYSSQSVLGPKRYLMIDHNQNKLIMNKKVTTPGTNAGHGLVRSVLHISDERSEPINSLVLAASKNKSRSADYVAETLSQVSELCETNEELAYAGYVVGLMLGPTEAVAGLVAQLTAEQN